MKQNAIVQLFVYGSLRSGFHSDAYHYVSKYFTLVGNARAKGLLVDMGDYPVAVPTSEDKYIIGELYEIKHREAFDFAIAQLDDYEGVNVEGNETQLYHRTVEDILVNNESVKAWVYWYSGEIANKPIVASGDVMQYIEEKKNR